MKEERPWGSYEILLDEEYTKVKKITVKPQQQLSLQYHLKREERWIIVKGMATVVIDDQVVDKYPGDHIHIPRGATHRIKNFGFDTDLIFIEVQLGDYFGEDDIVRIEDDYNRK